MSVSVIIPVYNAESFLNRAVDSVLAQTYQEFEIILVDDGSTDGSSETCKAYAASDSRIKLIVQDNSGPAAARNTGLNSASGEFIYFLDADDFIREDTLQILLKKYDECNADMILCNFAKQEDKDRIINHGVSFSPENEPFEGHAKILSPSDMISYTRHFLKHPSNHLISYCWARLYKLSIIKEHNICGNEDMRLFEDLVFNLEYLKHANEVAFVNEPLHVYVMHDSHVSASMAILDANSLLNDMGIFKEKTSEFLLQKNDGKLSKDEIQKEIGHALVHYAIIFLVRTCRLYNSINRKKIHDEIKKLISSTLFRECLSCYSPSGKNSRLLPLLMKLNLIDLLIWTCKHKAYKRYGRPKAE